MRVIGAVALFVCAQLLCGSASAQGLGASVPDPAQYSGLARDEAVNAVKALLSQPEASIDLAKIKVSIDHLVDPSVDMDNTLRQIESMAAEIRKLYPAGASKQVRAETLRAALFGPDPQRTRPFHYDLEDPTGEKTQNKLLSTYLRTKKGNCVSMPILFVLVGQKLGIDVALARAPQHLFVKYTDDAGRVFNLETTSGGFPRLDSSYQRDTPMTPQSIANGVYMRALTKRESAAQMVEVLVQHFFDRNEEGRALAVLNLMAERDPTNAEAMQNISYAYWRIREKNFVSRYPVATDVPRELRPLLIDLNRRIEQSRLRAEALGWREPSQAQQDQYRQIIERAKSNAGAG